MFARVCPSCHPTERETHFFDEQEDRGSLSVEHAACVTRVAYVGCLTLQGTGEARRREGGWRAARARGKAAAGRRQAAPRQGPVLMALGLVGCASSDAR